MQYYDGQIVQVGDVFVQGYFGHCIVNKIDEDVHAVNIQTGEKFQVTDFQMEESDLLRRKA